jgi:tRNA pseudouridine55 synthase
MRTSAGAYVRSLAHDLGAALGCGGHVTELRRTAMGDFEIESARTFEELEELAAEGRLEEALSASSTLLPDLPAHRIDEATAGRIAHGMDFQVPSFQAAGPAKRIKAIAPDGRLVAIAEIRLPGTYHPIVVF